MSEEIEVGVVVCSDTLDFITDQVGKVLIDWCEARGWRVLAYEIVPRDRTTVSAALLRVMEYPRVDVLFTVGGIGSDARDFTRLATEDIAKGPAAFTAETLDSLAEEVVPGKPYPGVGVRRDKTVIVNVPDSEEFFEGAFDAIADAVLNDLSMELA